MLVPEGGGVCRGELVEPVELAEGGYFCEGKPHGWRRMEVYVGARTPRVGYDGIFRGGRSSARGARRAQVNIRRLMAAFCPSPRCYCLCMAPFPRPACGDDVRCPRQKRRSL